MTNNRRAIDPITVEVVRSFYQSAALQMRNQMIRGSFNPIIYESHDFSLGLYNENAELIAEGPGVPAFVGTLRFAIQEIVKYVGEGNIQEGDVILSTYPYMIGSHTQDATMVQPIYSEGELFGYAAAKAHWIDLGAKDVFVTDTTDVFQEGLQLYGVKLVRAGTLNLEITEIIRANSRAPGSVLGDMTAQISACQLGAVRVRELITKYGSTTVRGAVEAILDHGEAIARKVIAEMPDGKWHAEGALDNDGLSDEPIPIRVTVCIKGDEVEFDASSSAPQQRGPVNSLYGRTVSVARLVLKMLIAPDYPANEGFFRPLKCTIPSKSILNAECPAPVFLYGFAGRSLGGAIFKAFCEIAPKLSVARDGNDLGGVIISWTDPESGQFRAGGMGDPCGQGASIDDDGESALPNAGHGDAQNIPVEIIEERYPIRVEHYALWQDSGGAGRYRGGLGISRAWHALQAMKVTLTVEATKFPAWGVDGGGYAKPNTVLLQEEGNKRLRGGKVTGYELFPGDRVEIRMGGGGGWGHPMLRDPDLVLRDLIAGYISPEAARKDYGIVVHVRDGGFRLDQHATQQYRQASSLRRVS
jgi:N-methylhydantoinase B